MKKLPRIVLCEVKICYFVPCYLTCFCCTAGANKLSFHFKRNKLIECRCLVKRLRRVKRISPTWRSPSKYHRELHPFAPTTSLCCRNWKKCYSMWLPLLFWRSFFNKSFSEREEETPLNNSKFLQYMLCDVSVRFSKVILTWSWIQNICISLLSIVTTEFSPIFFSSKSLFHLYL